MRRILSSRILRAAGATAAFTFAAPLSVAAPLSATLTKGETRRYALEQTTTVSVLDQSTVVNSRFAYHLNVTAVEEDGATVDVTIDSVRMAMAQGDTSIEYDSEAPAPEDAPPNPLAGALGSVAGAQMTLRLASSGEVVSIDDTVMRENPVLMQLLEPESQRRSLSRLFRVDNAPDNVMVGDSWSVTTTQEVDQMIGVQFTYTYTVASIDETRVTIDLAGDARLTIADENMPQELRPDLTLHELDGRVLWDTESGALESYAILTDFTLEGMNPQTNERVSARLRQDQTLRRLSVAD